MKRRTFLLAGLGGVGALVVGWAVLPAPTRLRGKAPLPLKDGELAFNGWVKIGADDAVTVIVPRCEMGQGVHTGLAMMLAEELDCDWRKVGIEQSPIDPIYRNFIVTQGSLPFSTEGDGRLRRIGRNVADKVTGLMGMMVTGGSTSIPDLWQPMREAGAAARATLVALAAREWAVPAAECSAADGKVTHPRAGSMGYGAVVAKLAAGKDGKPAALPEVGEVALKDHAAFKIIGQPLTRLDALAKVTGLANYACDVREPGMLFAALAHAPQRDAVLGALDDKAALAMPGVRGVVKLPSLAGSAAAVGVVADGTWQARRAAAALVPTWQPAAGKDGAKGAAAVPGDAEALRAALWKSVREGRDPQTFVDAGDAPKALAAATTKISAEYELPWLAHAAMEPMSCCAKVDGKRAVLHVGHQVPDVARKAVAKLLGLEEEAVEIRSVALGGAFGRRTELDIVLQAASIAREHPGKLVQLQWTREDDMRNDFYRPAAASRVEGAVADGRIVALHARSAVQSANVALTTRLLGFAPPGPDKSAVEGASDQAYRIPNLRVENEIVPLPVAVGVWRSVGYSYQAFIMESAIDELAQAAGADPVAFRLAHLDPASREHAVLRLVAEKSGWAAPPAFAPDGARVARGVALCTSFGSAVAQVVEVSMSADGLPRVHRVVVAVDVGTPINPGLIRQQIEGSVIFGLSAALRDKVTFEGGAVREGNFDTYPLMRIAEAPAIEVHIVPSRAAPSGVGEIGVPPAAPALVNALAALTGKRVRRLPVLAA
ncbi:MAG: xanthine dehydrogenase family protein molybdopterin-binding subunit [Gammaproteobacteria bacterium]|nr:xanthine dehydrogenase family protein molybdopterin-binding subunit [Gammaproteobacteria bacterium]